MKKIIKNILFGIVIILSSYLLIANFLHTFYVREYEKYDFDNINIERINDMLTTLEESVKNINELDNSVFSEMDLNNIQSNMEEILFSLRNATLLRFSGIQKIYLIDLIELTTASDYQKFHELLSTMDIVGTYDSTIGELRHVFEMDFLAIAFSTEELFQTSFNAYKYNVPTMIFDHSTLVNDYRVSSRVFNLFQYISKVNYVADIVLKVGGANG